MTQTSLLGAAATPRLGILLSGRGSNFLALHEAIERGKLSARIALVVSNKSDAPGLEAARRRGLPTLARSHRGMSREDHDADVVGALRAANIDWVCLAGYMRILSPVFVDAFPHRIVNIHPSLLPAFPGLHAQQQAWDHGVLLAGATVHLVDHGLDSGPIVAQAAVPTSDLSSGDELAARILVEEHRLYPAAMQRLLTEPWRIDGRRLEFETPGARKVEPRG
ncbi:MAG: phosphoribosylglycinamide formyltransferase [Acidobacteriota bacterium]